VRLVSLLPSATEIVYALGLGEQLVGVTFECEEELRATVEAKRAAIESFLTDLDARIARTRRLL
jgi:hypothetical protein